MNDKDLDGPPERMASAMPSLAQARETSESHPAELNRILRSASWRIIDIRPAHSFRNGHYDDSIHLPGDTWRRCPYLLPPRRRRICVLAGTEDQAHDEDLEDEELAELELDDEDLDDDEEELEDEDEDLDAELAELEVDDEDLDDDELAELKDEDEEEDED